MTVQIESARRCLDLLNFRRVLYFFEPLSNRNILPLAVQLPSLTTLSPVEQRAHEYKKNRLSKLMFPCWTLDELSVAAQNDPDICLEFDEVAKRFHQFGGIIRHVFAIDSQGAELEEEQRRRINESDPCILCAITTGIDADQNAPGENVSGYLLSYCNIQTAGPQQFRRAELDSQVTLSEVRFVTG